VSFLIDLRNTEKNTQNELGDFCETICEKKMRKKILLLSLFAGAAVGQTTPGQPTVILVGKFSCAARMYTPIQLQVWCFKDFTFKALAINLLADVSDLGLNLLIHDGTDFNAGTNINWTFSSASPPPAPPLGTPPPPPASVTWQAQITRANVADPIINGTLADPGVL
jgi:hypothetical protein